MAKSHVTFKPGTNPIPEIRWAAWRGVGLAAEHILAEARKIVPHDTGVLERSGRASHTSSDGLAQGAISFDTPYAVRVHESTTMRFRKGRSRKYLESAVNANQGRAQEIIAATIRGRL